MSGMMHKPDTPQLDYVNKLEDSFNQYMQRKYKHKHNAQVTQGFMWKTSSR
jgi:hypothetical protein